MKSKENAMKSNDKLKGRLDPTLSIASLMLLMLVCQPLAADNKIFTILPDFPGAIFTTPRGVNTAGDIVGFYATPTGVRHGFLLRGGSFTTIDPPGSLGTLAWGINDQGDIVGEYVFEFATHGFLLSGGTFTTIDHLGSGGLHLFGINGKGDVVGQYVFGGGFLLSGGIFSAIDFPITGAITA